MATLEEQPKDDAEMQSWYAEHDARYAILVASTDANEVVGWASLSRYSHRCAFDGVADLSVYVAREHRSRGIGSQLMRAIEETARKNAFHKIVLFALARNTAGKLLYRKAGFSEVGIFKEQGKLDGAFVDVLAMEKILRQ